MGREGSAESVTVGHAADGSLVVGLERLEIGARFGRGHFELGTVVR